MPCINENACMSAESGSRKCVKYVVKAIPEM